MFRHYISGCGIELGALHNPLDLTGLEVSEIRYVDREGTSDLRRRYPELQNLKLTPVDLIDDGEVLSKIEDASLDFIIANHFIEHTRNPIGTILAWLAILKASGVIFLAVPDYRYTFDSGRQLTSLVHLVADHESPIGLVRARDRQHCVEWATFVAKVPAEQVHEHAELLIEGDYSIHFHTFTLASFLDLLNYMHTQLRAPVVLKACADVTHDGNEFLVVLTRTP